MRDGKLRVGFGVNPGHPEMVINSKFDGLFERANWLSFEAMKGYRGDDFIEKMVKHERSRMWLEEHLDPSEPRCVCDRAHYIEEQTGSKSDILAAIEKAHERAPQFAKLSASYACRCLELGYLGHAKFYMDSAYCAAPENPAIAGLAFALRQKLDEVPPKRSHYEAPLATEEAIRAFGLVCAYIEKSERFPCSYWEAAIEPFSEKPELGDDRIFQRW